MGDDSLLDKFAAELCGAEWKLLEPHYKRDALFVAGSDLSLVEVAVDIAEDNVSKIKEVLESGQLRKPTEDEIEDWKSKPDEILGDFLIVSPYVIMQKKK